MVIIKVKFVSVNSNPEVITYKTYTERSDLPYEKLARLVQSTWSSHYRKEAIIAYDVDYLKWLTLAEGSLCVTANCGSELVGCAFAYPRTVFSNGHEYKAYYFGILSTHHNFQNRGIGRELIIQAFRECLVHKNADIVVASFEAISPGWPAFLSALRHSSIQFEQSKTEQFTIWGAVFDLKILNQYEPLKGLMRISLLPGIRNVIQYKKKSLDIPKVLADSSPEIRESDYSFGFKTDFNLSPLYQTKTTKDAGTFLFEFNKHEQCSISFKIEKLFKQGLPTVRAGHIQLVNAGKTKRKNLIKAFRSMNNFFLENECLSAFSLSSIPVSPYVLLRSGFVPTERKIHYALISPVEKKVKLNLSGKLYLDLV